MSYVHIIDHAGDVVGCSTASGWTDYDDQPIGLGWCEHINNADGSPRYVVEVPMPVFRASKHSLIDAHFTPPGD